MASDKELQIKYKCDYHKFLPLLGKTLLCGACALCDRRYQFKITALLNNGINTVNDINALLTAHEHYNTRLFVKIQYAKKNNFLTNVSPTSLPDLAAAWKVRDS